VFFLLLVNVGPGVSRVSLRFGIVLRHLARKTLDMGGIEGVWCGVFLAHLCGSRWGR
jgi:hypothetical protein